MKKSENLKKCRSGKRASGNGSGKKDSVKRGLAFSMAVAIGAAGLPAAGFAPAVKAYAAQEEQPAETAEGVKDTASGETDQTEAPEVLAGFHFDDGIDGWYYGAGWEYEYSGKDASSVEADNGRLKFNVDYTNDKEKGWSQAAAVWEPKDAKGLNLSGATGVTLNFIYDASKMTTGSFALKVYCDEGLDANADADMANAQTVSGDLKQTAVKISFDALGSSASDVKKFAVQLIGKSTDYKGAVWLDDIQITKEAEPDSSVDSKTAVKTEANTVTVAGKKLVTHKKDGSTQETALASEVPLADQKATADARRVYAYLKAVGSSDSVIYGHQNDISHKAGNEALSNSDTKDVTGSISGIFGIDTLSLTGNEYSAERYNEEYNASLAPSAENNVIAAAKLTNHAIADGAIVTLSAHMPNFSKVAENPDVKDGEPSYAKYDFSGYTPNDTSNDVMNQILPGGTYNKIYNAYLDMVADYAKRVKGAVLFRPFHENTGSWFWWGAAFCDPETYKNVYRYTVEYLRDTKGVHNMLYEYGPGSEAESVEEYGVRYPGDAYIDLVGFDMYDRMPVDDGVFMAQFQKELGIVESFAKKHHKLVAVTETGAANDAAPGDNQTALLKKDNGNKDWYNQILDIISGSEASYYLLWANFGKKDGFYTPYVDAVNADGSLHGHEMLDNFISFYNDARSIFAADQKEVLASGSIGKVTANAAVAGAKGYFTSPVAGTRILKAVNIKARLTNANAKTKVLFVAKTDAGKVKLKPKADGKGGYTAKLTAKQLKTLGKNVGTLTLYINDKRVQRYSVIYNIAAPKEDPYLIDGFENYYGVNDQLTGAWTVNTDSDCKVTLLLDKEHKSNGSYGLKFTYDETANGWGGATVSKEVDWSECNALQFYMIPDGKNQKTVIQINASGVTYEAYLQEYEAYRTNGAKPVLVTIPFTEFCQRDTEGNPKGGLVSDSRSIQSFGLWVNAIADSDAVSDGRVSGTLYYDNITAVKTEAAEVSFQPAK